MSLTPSPAAAATVTALMTSGPVMNIDLVGHAFGPAPGNEAGDSLPAAPGPAGP